MSYGTSGRSLFDLSRWRCSRASLPPELRFRFAAFLSILKTVLLLTCRCVNQRERKKSRNLGHRNRPFVTPQDGVGPLHANGCMSTAYGRIDNIVHLE